MLSSLTYLEIFISGLLILVGLLVVFSKKIIQSIIFLSVLSMVAGLAFVILKAPDVAMTEIVIGSGLVTFLFLFALKAGKKVEVKK